MRGAFCRDAIGDFDLPPPLHFFASRDIDAGEELCWDYGDEYWKGESPGAVAFRRRALQDAVASGELPDMLPASSDRRRPGWRWPWRRTKSGTVD